MKKSEKVISFAAGCALYPLLELLWRGRTHWSMALAGGLAGLCLYPVCTKKGNKMVCCKVMAIITLIELAFGVVFNIILKMNVWDYSKQRWNLWGQICLPYCLLWLLLAVPIRALCRGLKQICS